MLLTTCGLQISTLVLSLTLLILMFVVLNRDIEPSPLSEEDHEEKAKKCEFVQGLLRSTFLGDDDF